MALQSQLVRDSSTLTLHCKEALFGGGVCMCLKSLCEITGWGHNFVLSHMCRICKHMIMCLQGLVAFQILVWGLPSTVGFFLLSEDAKQYWEIGKGVIFSSKTIQIVYQHVCGSKITKLVKRINQYTEYSKKHVLKEVVDKMPLFPISFHLGLVLLNLHTKSDLHRGMEVLVAGHSYKPTIKWGTNWLPSPDRHSIHLRAG